MRRRRRRNMRKRRSKRRVKDMRRVGNPMGGVGSSEVRKLK